MKSIKLRTLTCYESEDRGGDELILQVFTDGNRVSRLKRDMNAGDKWDINDVHSFRHEVRIHLVDDELSPDWLGDIIIKDINYPVALNSMAFTKDDADYALTFSISVPRAIEASAIDHLSFRQFFSRLGQGVMRSERYQKVVDNNNIYYISDESISYREIIEKHKQQDNGKSNTTSIRQWIETHCDYFSPKTLILAKDRFRSNAEVSAIGNWESVENEESRVVSGFCERSRVTNTDNPLSHETRDWNMNVVPDPAFMYMLGSGLKHAAGENQLVDHSFFGAQIAYDQEIEGSGEGFNLVPLMENEWETGSMPLQWRPFWGQYITLFGRHIWDVGHSPVHAEIHPPHTIIREHTTAGKIRGNNYNVPVNRAHIGIGFSGGFPRGSVIYYWDRASNEFKVRKDGDYIKRWELEFNKKPSSIRGDTEACWPTNLKKHPLKFRLYPPVPRPSQSATLHAYIVLSRYIKTDNWHRVDDFLELTQYDDPAKGGKRRAFRYFDDAYGFPSKNTPTSLKPKFTLGTNSNGNPSYYDVSIDLSGSSGIPLGYYAVVECGWKTKGNHKLQRYKVTFESVKAIETDEIWDDWHLYYGVNGEWTAWWTDNFIREGREYVIGHSFYVWTVDNLPLVIRDCGIEWDGTDFGNEHIDPVALIAKPRRSDGYNHLMQIARLASVDDWIEIVEPQVNDITPATRDIKIHLFGNSGISPQSNSYQSARIDNDVGTKHRWTIRIELTNEY